MSINHQVPRQDRRGVRRSPVKIHKEHTVGTVAPTILDPQNGRGVGGSGNLTPGGARAPGSLGPPLSDDLSSW